MNRVTEALHIDIYKDINKNAAKDDVEKVSLLDFFLKRGNRYNKKNNRQLQGRTQQTLWPKLWMLGVLWNVRWIKKPYWGGLFRLPTKIRKR